MDHSQDPRYDMRLRWSNEIEVDGLYWAYTAGSRDLTPVLLTSSRGERRPGNRHHDRIWTAHTPKGDVPGDTFARYYGPLPPAPDPKTVF